MISWRTLALVNKFKQKLLSSRQLPYENLSPSILAPPENDILNLTDSVTRDRKSTTSEPDVTHTDVSATLSRGSLTLKTINEEDCNSEARSELCSSNQGLVTSQVSVDTKQHSSVSRTKSLDSISCSQPVVKRRRGGFLFKQEPPRYTPSSDYLIDRNTDFRTSGTYVQNAALALRRRMRVSSVYKTGSNGGGRRNSVSISSVAQMVYNFNRHVQKKKKEIRAAKTIIILVFYYIITLLLFVVSFYYVSMSSDTERKFLPYWLTFYPYIIYINALFNPIIHFWRNARVRNTVLRIICTRRVNDTFRRWSLRGGRNCCFC